MGEDTDLARLRALLEEREAELRKLRLTLEILSPVDVTTGLPNRAGVLDAIETQLEWLKRKVQPFAALRVVLDLEGEATPGELAHFGALLKSALRGIDVVGRLDASDFICVLPDTEAAVLPPVFDRLAAILAGELGPAGVFGFAAVAVRTAPEETPGGILDRLLGLVPDRRRPPVIDV